MCHEKFLHLTNKRKLVDLEKEKYLAYYSVRLDIADERGSRDLNPTQLRRKLGYIRKRTLEESLKILTTLSPRRPAGKH